MTEDVNQYGLFPVCNLLSDLQKLVSDAVKIHHNLNSTLCLKSTVCSSPSSSGGNLSLSRTYSVALVIIAIFYSETFQYRHCCV
jgi:hypothetical protein